MTANSDQHGRSKEVATQTERTSNLGNFHSTIRCSHASRRIQVAVALSKYRGDIATVFDLLGSDENDLTAALGWILHKCEVFRYEFWNRLGRLGDPSSLDIRLEVAGDAGRTDLELWTENAVVIVEAKKGWLLPDERQLRMYAPRLAEVPVGMLVTLSDSSSNWARHALPDSVLGVPVRHLPWDEIRAIVRLAQSRAGTIEKVWLREFSAYLSGGTSVRSVEDQWVYNVVLAKDPPWEGSALTYIDLSSTMAVYAHPWGGRNGWPKRPPTFMGFRWDGRVRQVNRVLRHEVITNLSDLLPDIPRGPDETLIAYHLGPKLPVPEIRTGKTYASGRVWALLDQMLIHETLADAVRASKEIGTPEI